MDKTFFVWYKCQFHSFKVKCIFMHNHAPFHLSKLTYVFFGHKRFIGEKIMEWLPSSPYLNLIKNLWSIMKVKLSQGYKQYNSKINLWEAIKTTMSEIDPAEVKNIYKINI